MQKTGLRGWIGGDVQGVCAFISKPNEFSGSGSCISANQTVVGSGVVTRAITQADLPTGISWEGEGNPLENGNGNGVLAQGDTQNQVDETIDSANEIAQTAIDWSQMFGGNIDMGWFSEEMISGVPNWALVAGLGMFLFKDKLL